MLSLTGQPTISRLSAKCNSTNSPQRPNSNHAESLPLLPSSSNLPFQDHLLSLTILTQRALSQKISTVTVPPSSVITKWSAFSRPSLNNKSTNPTSSVHEDLNYSHAVSSLSVMNPAACHFKTISQV